MAMSLCWGRGGEWMLDASWSELLISSKSSNSSRWVLPVSVKDQNTQQTVEQREVKMDQMGRQSQSQPEKNWKNKEEKNLI